MHVRHNYTDVAILLQNISRIQGYPSPPAEVIPQTRFRARFNNHVTPHVTHKIDEWPTA